MFVTAWRTAKMVGQDLDLSSLVTRIEKLEKL